MTSRESLIPAERIEHSILLLRGEKVMLDSDLASLYGVETRALIQAVERNRSRFPGDFMFQLTPEEKAALRSQSVILETRRGKHRKYLPYVFTEQGVAMLSSVLRSPRKYDPLSSVWEKSDRELIEAMLAFYPTIKPSPILDATYNAGRMWKGSKRKVVSMDIDPRYNTMIVGDNREMAGVLSKRFGVVVYDPPHVGPQGRNKSVKRFDVDFGATMECGKKHGWSLSYLYPPFLKQAKRVLKPDGLLLAKITDMVNSHRSRWAHCDFMRMAEEAGFTVCDLIVKIRNGPMVSTKWKNAHHARKRHCFWIVCRNSESCERC